MIRKRATTSAHLDSEMSRQLAAGMKHWLAEQPTAGTCKVRMAYGESSQSGSFCGRKVAANDLCYWHLPDTGKYSRTVLDEYFGKDVTLAEALEEEVASGRSLESAFLQDCGLGGSFLRKGPNLSGAKLMNANLRGAWMSESDLTNAIFLGADLTRAGLSSCILSGANFYNARLFEVKLRDNDLENVKHLYRWNFRGLGKFGVPRERILEDYPEQAILMYRRLVSHFSSQGQFDDASWAAYRASLLHHRVLQKSLSISNIKAKQWMAVDPRLGPVQSHPLVEYLLFLVQWLKSGLFLLTTGYGEKPGRVVASALFTILAYSGLYLLPGAISGRGFYDALYFSMVTFTTLGYGDMLPRGVFRLVAASEALSGILLTGLFLFCLGRKTVSRV